MANVPKSGSGIKVAKTGPIIPCLMFANDYLILYKANRITARNIKPILEEDYCNISGELVDYRKSMVQFPKGNEKNVKLGIADILKVLTSNSIRTYLGCRNIHREKTKGDFVILTKSVVSWQVES